MTNIFTNTNQPLESPTL